MDFVEVAHFRSRLEAETVGHALDPHGIPFIIKGEDLGIYGGMPGPTLQGASLWVPEDRVKDVAALLSCVVKPPPEA